MTARGAMVTPVTTGTVVNAIYDLARGDAAAVDRARLAAAAGLRALLDLVQLLDEGQDESARRLARALLSGDDVDDDAEGEL